MNNYLNGDVSVTCKMYFCELEIIRRNKNNPLNIKNLRL